MAGDWIAIERATPDKPEVWAMAESLGIEPDAVLGKLVRVWLWFDEQTTDGDAACNARSVTSVTLTKRIDALTSVSGFAEAMRKVGWLNGTTMPGFEVHLGKSAKKRLLTSRRVKRLRNDGSVTKALPQNRTEQSKPIQRGKRELPEGWTPKPETIEHLSAEFGFAGGDAERYLVAFRDACAAKGYRYQDFDAAFSNCVRKDWPGFRNGAGKMPVHSGAGKLALGV